MKSVPPDKRQPPRGTAALVGFLVGAIVFACIPARIISEGYFPSDDALRHAAHAVSGRAWDEVMLLAPGFDSVMDTHPGWHRLLRLIHELSGTSAGGLVYLSIHLAFLAVGVGGLAASGSPLAWLLACAGLLAVDSTPLARLALGRPFFFSMAALTVLLFQWTDRQRRPAWREWVAVWAALSVSIAMHPPSIYLWALAFPALILCGDWRRTAIFAAGWAGAVATVASVSGWQNTVAVPIAILKAAIVQSGTDAINLVPEFQPAAPNPLLLAIVAMVVALRASGGRDLRKEMLQPDLCLFGFAYLLGAMNGRFYYEWGYPALLVWSCRQLRDGLGIESSGLSKTRDTVLLMFIATVAIVLLASANYGGRYNPPRSSVWLNAPERTLQKELPDAGGILYSADMGIFYALYHRFPAAGFRYSTAFEPGLMPPEDLAVFRNLQTFRNYALAKPWFDKMEPADRIVIQSDARPEWPGMTFRPLGREWIGRKSDP